MELEVSATEIRQAHGAELEWLVALSSSASEVGGASRDQAVEHVQQPANPGAFG